MHGLFIFIFIFSNLWFQYYGVVGFTQQKGRKHPFVMQIKDDESRSRWLATMVVGMFQHFTPYFMFFIFYGWLLYYNYAIIKA